MSYDETLARDIESKFALYQDRTQRPKRKSASTSKKQASSAKKSPKVNSRAPDYENPQKFGQFSMFNAGEGQSFQAGGLQGPGMLGGGAEGGTYFAFEADVDILAYP